MKKILFLTYDFPYPTNSGGKNRAYHMLKYSGDDIKKYLFSFIRSDFKTEYVNKMNDIGVEVAGFVQRRKVIDPRNVFGLLRQESIFKTIYFSKSVLSDIVNIIQEHEIDIVHFESLYTSFFISDQIGSLGVKQVFGTENIEHKLYEDYTARTSSFIRPFLEIQARKIKEEETDLFRKADLCIAVSNSDARVVGKHTKKCEIVENGVDLDEYVFKTPQKKKNSRLFFVGNFTYFPNVDAINYFYDKVFKNLPNDISLTIVGKKVGSLKFIDDSRIEAKEYVERLQDEYQKADIMVSPLRLGGGTNFKVLEAMATGLPIVSFPERVKDLEVVSEKHMLIVQDSRSFREQILKLLDDDSLAQYLAKNARKLVEDKFDWRKIGKKLNTSWKNLVK